MVSILLSVWCVEWRWCVLLLIYLTQCVWPMPSTPSAHGVSTAAVSRAVCCQVYGVCGACVCLWCLCGGVSLVRSPLMVVVGGAVVCGGACVVVVGGIALEGWWCQWLPLLSLLVSPSVCWRPPHVCVVVLLDGGAWCMLWCPVFVLGPAPLYCPVPLCVVLFLLHHPALQCVCCHSIVGLGCVFCDRVVLLWNSGGDCVGQKGGVCDGVMV